MLVCLKNVASFPLRQSLLRLPASACGTYSNSVALGGMDTKTPAGQQAREPKKPELSPESQAQQQAAGVPPAQPTGTLQDVDPNELMTKRNQILWEQAQRGEQPGLMLMQDALSGEKKAQTWGNEPTILEPDEQN